MYTLGISAYYHDSAVTLLRGDEIIAAAQEERFTRKKNDERFPHLALNYVLSEAQITLADVDAIVFYEKPILKFERILEAFLKEAPFGLHSFIYGVPKLLQKLFFRRLLTRELAKHKVDKREIKEQKLYFSTHHMSHAASAFFPSPFQEALVLTLDGVGEWTTTAVFKGKKNTLIPIKEIHFPHSLGLLYSTFTALLGFKVNEGEYKVMGLAPYGEPRFLEVFKKELISLHDDGSFALNMSYFRYTRRDRMYSKKLVKLCELNKPRGVNDPLLQVHMDIAASLQKLLEFTLIQLITALKSEFEFKNLCLAGGVALNCVANGIIERECGLEGLWIQPAAGDAGGALGSSLAYYHGQMNGERKFKFPDAMKAAKLGPSYTVEVIKAAIDKYSERSNSIQIDNEIELIEKCREYLIEGKTIGWFQGRMEFGPRALGSRSILGDPRSPQMQRNLNLKIKFRESFRPFAPMVLEEEAHQWFENASSSPYMLKVYQLKAEHRLALSEDDKSKKGLQKLGRNHCKVAATTHIDYSARVQTLRKADNPRLHTLIKEFHKKTGVPMIVNTSFNLKDEPIVCSPTDALNCYFKSGLDILVMENFIVTKHDPITN